MTGGQEWLWVSLGLPLGWPKTVCAAVKRCSRMFGQPRTALALSGCVAMPGSTYSRRTQSRHAIARPAGSLLSVAVTRCLRRNTSGLPEERLLWVTGRQAHSHSPHALDHPRPDQHETLPEGTHLGSAQFAALELVS